MSSLSANRCLEMFSFLSQGLFARRRQLLLTEGPHLYYVDPVNRVLKGEIPWSSELRPEAKNFKTFFVHTVNKDFYAEKMDSTHLRSCVTSFLTCVRLFGSNFGHLYMQKKKTRFRRFTM